MKCKVVTRDRKMTDSLHSSLDLSEEFFPCAAVQNITEKSQVTGTSVILYFIMKNNLNDESSLRQEKYIFSVE